jgi:hypothetical protein
VYASALPRVRDKFKKKKKERKRENWGKKRNYERHVKRK